MLNLVIIELTEIRHIHLSLGCICNSEETVKFKTCLVLNPLNRSYNIGELAYARWLDYDSVRSILLGNLYESLTEISHK